VFSIDTPALRLFRPASRSSIPEFPPDAPAVGERIVEKTRGPLQAIPEKLACLEKQPGVFESGHDTYGGIHTGGGRKPGRGIRVAEVVEWQNRRPFGNELQEPEYAYIQVPLEKQAARACGDESVKMRDTGQRIRVEIQFCPTEKRLRRRASNA